MPINIFEYSNGKPGDKVAWLCEDDWELPPQIDYLEKWLKENHIKLDKGPYVADIGFSRRPDAAGGGGVLTIETMKIMVSIGMELFLSEYPEFEED
jgi:hypothetical protein